MKDSYQLSNCLGASTIEEELWIRFWTTLFCGLLAWGFISFTIEDWGYYLDGHNIEHYVDFIDVASEAFVAFLIFCGAVYQGSCLIIGLGWSIARNGRKLHE